MIFVVDSKASSVEAIKEALAPDGYEIATFDGGESMLDLMDAGALEEPDLIISEVAMTGMNGFELKREFTRKFPNSLTPFVFYTEQGDAKSMMKGLALGVDDYIVKPMPQEVFRVKMRSILNRKNHYLVHTFVGDLGKMQFFKLMQFCETRGLTGEVEIMSGELDTILPFKAGQMQSDLTSDDVLIKVYDLKSGTFVIRAMPMDFSEIMEYSAEGSEKAEPQAAEVYSNKEKPMGKLSGIQVDKKLFQIQTEFTTQPSNQLVTIVIYEGRVVSKKIEPAPPGKPEKRLLESMMYKQHDEVEAEIRGKLNSLMKKKSSEGAKERFARLFEEGFEKYRSEDFSGALKAWQEAYEINPTDKTLETNIRILKKKLDAGAK